MCDQRASPDAAIAVVAARQHGVMSVEQLRALGLDKHRVRYRVRVGRLHRVHRGVYGVGYPARSIEALWMAAILACGRPVGAAHHGAADGGGALADCRDWNADDLDLPTMPVLEYWGAALSHLSAAQLWGLLPSAEGAVDISIRGDGGRKKRHGIRLHRSLTLLPPLVTLRDGFPVTTPAKTISDLRRVSKSSNRLISGRGLRRAVRQANVLGLPIEEIDRRDRTRSDLERDFLRLCRRQGLPMPEVNVRIGPHLVDFLWREARLVVETDGYVYHQGRVAFEGDRARDLSLRGLGCEVVRLSGRQLAEEPAQIANVLERLLSNGKERRQAAP